jgi:hypothetical protein
MQGIRRTILICPKCGEDNSDNFRFCGMCGAVLEAKTEARRPAGAPVPNLPPVPKLTPHPPKIANTPEPPLPAILEDAIRPADQQVTPIGGPSMLGLSQPATNRPSLSQPDTDSLREKAFSGLDSFFEPEQPKNGGRRILLLVVLLAALALAGWWTYSYLAVADSHKSEAVTGAATKSAVDTPTNTSNDQPSTKAAAQNAAPAPDAGSSQPPLPAAVPQGPPENATASPDAPKNASSQAKPATTVTAAIPKVALGTKSAGKREPSVASAKAPKLPEPAAADTGDAAFRKGEAYLYGRGVPENCDEAVKNLKAASAKSNAKARSTFGTMYATGHCVPRDLPTSYLWFAMALRLDPNNQILEKDLSAVWNQMTPPERQMATRMKQ